MKQIHFYLFGSMMMLTISCSKDDNSIENKDCGKESSTLCYAHNWTEFSSLNNLVDGDGVYSHTYKNDPEKGISYFTYRVSLKNVCLKAILSIDLTNVVIVGTPVTYLGDLYINGIATDIPMNNLNGIITGHLTQSMLGFPINSIEIENAIVIPNNKNGFEFDTTWYNDNVSSHGMEIKFQNPK